MNQGIKHLVECHCILPQFQENKDPIFHKFPVFSVIDKFDVVVTKFAQCSNCGVIHRVFDISKSEALLGNDETTSVLTKEDIIHSISVKIAKILETYEVDISTWEEVAFIVENKKWGSIVILSKERSSNGYSGKALKILDDERFKIEPYSFRDTFE